MEAICIRTSPYVLPGTSEGRGVFAARNIAAGEALLSVDGPVVDFATTLAMGEAQCYALQFADGAYYDLVEPIRFSNHSCSPNSGIRNNALVALCDILEGEEVVWDYSTTMDERSWTMRCRCGATNCRGIVDDFRTLPVDIQHRYLDLGVVMPFIAEQYLKMS